MLQITLAIIGLIISLFGIAAQLYSKEIRTWFDDPPAEERPAPECACPVGHPPSPSEPAELPPASGTSVDVVPPAAPPPTEAAPPTVTELAPPPAAPQRGRIYNLDDMARKPSTTRMTFEDQ